MLLMVLVVVSWCNIIKGNTVCLCNSHMSLIIIIIIIIIIICNWVVTWWQWLFYMYTYMR